MMSPLSIFIGAKCSTRMLVSFEIFESDNFVFFYNFRYTKILLYCEVFGLFSLSHVFCAYHYTRFKNNVWTLISSSPLALVDNKGKLLLWSKLPNPPIAFAIGLDWKYNTSSQKWIFCNTKFYTFIKLFPVIFN